MRDFGAMRALLERERPDALVHLAFVLNPIHDEARMYDIDVNGTEAVLRAASEAGIEQVLVTSSATAYGAFPDNPRADDRGVARCAAPPDFSYARDKTEADRICQLWAARASGPRDDDRAPVHRVRPQRRQLHLAQLGERRLHADRRRGRRGASSSCTRTTSCPRSSACSTRGAGGTFNLAGDGTMTWRESAELVGLKTRDDLDEDAEAALQRRLEAPRPEVESPPGNADFIRYPWIVSTAKLKVEIDWEPSKNTREVFVETMRQGPPRRRLSAPCRTSPSSP